MSGTFEHANYCAPRREDGKNLFLVAVDESHGDSHDAFQAARSFAKPEDRVTLFSVIPKTQISDAKKDHLMKAYVDYTKKDDQVFIALAPSSDTDSVAKVFVKEAKIEDANILFLGCGSKLSHGTLGSVTDELLKESKRSVCVVKPGTHMKKGKEKEVIYCYVGSDACKDGLVQLLALLNPASGDSLKIVTVSHHEGDKDKAILDSAREVCAGSAMKIEFQFVKRNSGNSVGEELADFAEKEGATLLSAASHRGKEARLGSTTAWLCKHGPTSTLVMKADQTKKDGK